MKNRTKVALSIFAIAIASIFTSEYTSSADANNAAGPAGNTGSPGDGSNCQNCHGSNQAATVAITSTIPTAGYTAGTVYRVTGTITTSAVKIGFQMSPQNTAGALLGTMSNPSTGAQLINGGGTFNLSCFCITGATPNKYITHTSSGTSLKTWSFDWTAPAAGTGDVTFYGCFLVTNNDGNNDSGDHPANTSLLVHEATACTAPTITGTTPGSVCDAGTVTLGATASAGTVNWYTAATGGTALTTGATFTTPNISATTTYYVDATNGGCTTSTRTAVIATVNTTPTITSTTPGSNCGAGTVTLRATASVGTINWYDVPTGGNPIGSGLNFTTPNISSTTTYYVDATNNGCTTSSRQAVIATINPAAPTITSAASASRCDAGTVTLGAIASADTIHWYSVATGGSSLGTGTSFTTPNISATTTYYVDATNSGCTTPSRTAVIATVNTTPSITNVTRGSRCGSGTVTLGATASSDTIHWYAAATGGNSLGTGTSFTTPSITSTTTYYVDATNSGCTTPSRTSVAATVNSIPTATIIGNATICSGTSSKINIALTGTAPWSFTYGSAAGSNPVSGITASTYTTTVPAGTYTVSAVSDSNNCFGTHSGNAVITEISPILVTNFTTTCNGGSYTVDFDITGGDVATYTVTGGAGNITTSTHFHSASITSGTAYSFSVTDAYNCNPVSVNGSRNCGCAATATISGGGTICNGNAATISITLAGTAPWQFTYAVDGVNQTPVTGQTTSPYTFTTTTTGDYTLISVNDATCQGSTNGTATVSQTTPAATISGGGTICADGSAANLSFDLTAGSAPWSFTYSDGITTSGPIIANATNKLIPVSTAGTYTIISMSAGSCNGTASGSATVNVNTLPTVGSTVSPSATVCEGTSVTLTGTGTASSYVWSGLITDGQSFTPASSATYTVTGTDGTTNCSNTATSTIIVNSLPTITTIANPSSAVVCAGNGITLSGAGATSYVWSGNVVDATPFVPVASDTYTVTGTDANNCSNTTTRAITVNPLPTVGSTVFPSSASVCAGGSVTLTGTGSATSYSWSGGISDGVAFAATTTATYTITGTDGATNCLSEATQLITVSSCGTIPPTPTITRPAPGTALVSSAATGNQWYFNGILMPGDTNQILILTPTTPSGNYSVVVRVNGLSSAPSADYPIVNTGITEIGNDTFFNVYPNPNDGNFNVSFDVAANTNYKLEIKNMLGQIIYQETLNNFSGLYSKQLSISGNGSGLYTISLTNSGSQTIKKIIVY